MDSEGWIDGRMGERLDRRGMMGGQKRRMEGMVDKRAGGWMDRRKKR